MAGNDHDIATLNSLITTTLDSVDGYTETANDNESGRLGSLFTARATERKAVVQALQSEVARLGGEPATSSSVLGGMHRLFTNIKSAVTGQDDKAIVDEVERGEDHIKAKFESAMKDPELSASVRELVEKAYGSVRAGHDQMRDLKHTMHAAD